MSEIIKRPFSIWITQGLLLLFGFLFLAGFISVLISVFRMPAESTGMGTLNWLGIASTSFLLLAIILFISFTFYSLVKRKPYGRWLGVACMSLLFLMSVYGQITQPQAQQYNSSSERAAGIFTIVIIHALLLTLIITLIRSEKVIKFFKPEQVETPEQPDAEDV